MSPLGSSRVWYLQVLDCRSAARIPASNSLSDAVEQVAHRRCAPHEWWHEGADSIDVRLLNSALFVEAKAMFDKSSSLLCAREGARHCLKGKRSSAPHKVDELKIELFEDDVICDKIAKE